MSALRHLPDRWLRAVEAVLATVAPVASSRLRLALWCEQYRRDTLRDLLERRDRHGWPTMAGV